MVPTSQGPQAADSNNNTVDDTGAIAESSDAVQKEEQPLARANHQHAVKERPDGKIELKEEDAWHDVEERRSGSFTRAIRAALAEDAEGVPLIDPEDLISSEPPRDGRPYSATVAHALKRIALKRAASAIQPALADCKPAACRIARPTQ